MAGSYSDQLRVSFACDTEDALGIQHFIHYPKHPVNQLQPVLPPSIRQILTTIPIIFKAPVA
jgi:hypothetical protein